MKSIEIYNNPLGVGLGVGQSVHCSNIITVIPNRRILIINKHQETLNKAGN